MQSKSAGKLTRNACKSKGQGQSLQRCGLTSQEVIIQDAPSPELRRYRHKPIFDFHRFLFLLKWATIVGLIAAGLVANLVHRAERPLRTQIALEQAAQAERVE